MYDGAMGRAIRCGARSQSAVLAKAASLNLISRTEVLAYGSSDRQ